MTLNEIKSASHLVYIVDVYENCKNLDVIFKSDSKGGNVEIVRIIFLRITLQINFEISIYVDSSKMLPCILYEKMYYYYDCVGVIFMFFFVTFVKYR